MAMKTTTAARIGIASILLIVLLALSGTSASAGSALRGRDVDLEGDVDLLAEAEEINWRSLQGEDDHSSGSGGDDVSSATTVEAEDEDDHSSGSGGDDVSSATAEEAEDEDDHSSGSGGDDVSSATAEEPEDEGGN